MSQQKQTVFNYNNEEIGGCLMLMYDSDDEVDKFNQSLQESQIQLQKTATKMQQIQLQNNHNIKK
ncbi:unnamed protein product [Paramecium primaurelia]|uniref:Uncharacterized protein n=2 Tax=Paramecium TaxID=5884 RepID=A0A8S1WGT6_9CILI|nr:unnamed protein product [Paramecium primaurelia]CAD8185156.1 unnamed protein product [Paramecium pentaurelia]